MNTSLISSLTMISSHDSTRFRLGINPTALSVELRPNDPFRPKAIAPIPTDIYHAEAVFKDKMVEEVSRAFEEFRRVFAAPKSCQTCRYHQQHHTTLLCGLCVGHAGRCVDFNMWEAKDE